MSPRHIFLLFLHLLGWLCTSGQSSGYSLQAAVDELHRREAAKYPLNAPPPTHQRFAGGAFLGSSPQDQDYWDDDPDGSSNTATASSNSRNRHKLNKLLAQYLERERYGNDHGALTLNPFGGYEFDEDNNNNIFYNSPEEKKRASYFRERDNKWSSDNSPSSVFRERETAPANGGDHAELTDQFLREIEESQDLEREARYKDALRRVWGKYRQQENELDNSIHEDYKRKLANPNFYMGPLMQKKRSYPVLPWLPYTSRKKRGPAIPKTPVKKRSSDENSNFGKTDEKVAWELNELFGGSAPEEDKKKRSTDDSNVHKTLNSNALTTNATTLHDSKSSSSNEINSKHLQQQHSFDQNTHHQQHKRSNQPTHSESHEECDECDESKKHDDSDEHEGHREHRDEHQGDDDEDEHDVEENEENEEDKRKKKRDIKQSSIENQKQEEREKVEPTTPNESAPNIRRKKSVEWPKYLGIDRKKKTGPPIEGADTSKSKHSTNSNDDNDFDERDIDPDKLENMDKKLQAIEDLIIDDTIKYTGAHEGIANPEEIRRLKDHVLSRLATAYSLEKMRRALEKLRESVDNENHLLRNVIESESKSQENDILEQKRLSVKKEKVQYENHNQHLTEPNVEKSKEIHSNAMTSSSNANIHNNNNNRSSCDDNADNDDDDDLKKKRKKKRNNNYPRYPELRNDLSNYDPERGVGLAYDNLNDAYLGNKNYMIGSSQCPVVESMAERCRNVDLLMGDIHNDLLPICGVHQICYLCGTSRASCDYQYLIESTNICGRNNDCHAAAHSALMILRGTPGPQIGPKECIKNDCLYNAMREIGL